MFNCRLEPTYDAEERQLISDLFNGGAMRNLNPNSIIVSINDKYPIDVKCIQSFSSGQFLSEIAMDAFLELYAVSSRKRPEPHGQFFFLKKAQHRVVLNNNIILLF